MLRAVLAPHTGLNLSSNTDTIACFTSCDFAANAEDLSDNFMADADGCCWEFTPATGNGVNI